MPRRGDPGRVRRVLFLRLNVASFVAKDLAILRSRYEAVEGDCRTAGGIVRAIRAVPSAECVFCWFGSLRFLPIILVARLFRRPVIVVAGGYDVASVPEIRYGNMARPWSRLLGRWLFRLATIVVPFSESGGQDARRHAKVPERKLHVVPLGFDASEAPPVAHARPKQRLVLTVGNVDRSTLHRKGLLAFARVSRLLPDVRFVLAGSAEPEALTELRAAAGANAELLGFVSLEELRRLFSEAKVYLQLSLHEGFGAAVAEAMLYGCVPVVSNRFSLVEVVGGSGVFVEPGDLPGIAAAVRGVLDDTLVLSERPATRILTRFALESRRDRLLRLVEGIVSGPLTRSGGLQAPAEPTSHREYEYGNRGEVG